MSDQKLKADNLRKAHKFRLFRYTELMKIYSFDALREYYLKLHNVPALKIRLRKIFSALRWAVIESKAQKPLKQRYWAFWKRSLRAEPYQLLPMEG